ncbi:heat shock factor protein-like isoform X2 [Styela clava]|uniref:heat shock factor protein-like isoform X2 n=1 Tax=Styela clava TaxID=7725 RepID=UPI00193AA129|nr:heat shock factor protein-like isoform X2 [Styela clava]
METTNAPVAVMENPTTSNIPTFLLKLVNMLKDESNHEYVDWNEAGTSFIVKDQVQFSKIVLPKYFKHNKFASFVRQLNMYGFRKITSLTQSGLNNEKEEIEFYHYLFIRGEEVFLEHIKRKVPKPEESNRRNNEDVTKVLDDVKQMKGYQENITSQLSELKQENEDLWREVVNLRHKHSHQQKVVNKLIQFLVNLVHQHGIGVKRKLPLMIEDGSSGSSNYVPAKKYQKPLLVSDDDNANDGQLALEEPTKPTVSFPASVMEPQDNNVVAMGSGPYITEVTTPQGMSSYSGASDMNTAALQMHDPVFVNSTLSSAQARNPVPPNPAYDVNQYIESTLNTPSTVVQPSGTVTFPDEEEDDNFGGLINPAAAFGGNQVAISTTQSSTSNQQQPAYYSPPQQSRIQSPITNAQNTLTRYSPPRSPKLLPGDLSSHVDSVQNNLENIQDLLFNNDQVQLDYGLIQELFSTSPDIMPPRVDMPAVSGSGNITGNELILHPGVSANRNGSQKDLEDDLKELENYM